MWDITPISLREDFPLAGIETPLPADDVAEVTQANVDPAPMMGGPFVSSGDGMMSESEPVQKMKVGQNKQKNQNEHQNRRAYYLIRCKGCRRINQGGQRKMALNVGPSPNNAWRA